MEYGDQLTSSALACEEVQRLGTAENSYERALRSFLGWDPKGSLRFADQCPVAQVGLPTVVLTRSLAPKVTQRLASEGYIHQHRFAVLPSRKRARWLLPPTYKGRPLDGFELYRPF